MTEEDNILEIEKFNQFLYEITEAPNAKENVSIALIAPDQRIYELRSYDKADLNKIQRSPYYFNNE